MCRACVQRGIPVGLFVIAARRTFRVAITTDAVFRRASSVGQLPFFVYIVHCILHLDITTLCAVSACILLGCHIIGCR